MEWVILGILAIAFLFWLHSKQKQSKSKETIIKCANGEGENKTVFEFTSQDIETVRRCAQRLVDIINESKEFALTSNNPETKISRLQLAQDKLKELKKMARQYPFLKLLTLDEFEAELSEISFKIQQRGYMAIADANEAGQRLERGGFIDEAILKYEEIIANAVDTPFPYRRLAILVTVHRNLDN